MEVSLALAFAAGLLSFVSPCVLALVPVYLAFLGETAAVEVAAGPAGVGTATGTPTWRGPLLSQALLFIAGFSVLFILLGTSLGLLGSALFRIEGARQVAGAVVIGIGLLTTGIFGPVLDRFMRVGVSTEWLPAARAARAVALGALVAVGWTPCIGPVLGAILTMGASSQDAWVAALLLVAYSAGLAVPFLAAALALPRLRPLLAFLRQHHRGVQVVSGVFIMGIGVLILTNAFARLAGLFSLFI
jgi:cytochrome c-type biogenesis protein